MILFIFKTITCISWNYDFFNFDDELIISYSFRQPRGAV